MDEHDHALDALRYLVSRLDFHRGGRQSPPPPPPPPAAGPEAPRSHEPGKNAWRGRLIYSPPPIEGSSFGD